MAFLTKLLFKLVLRPQEKCSNRKLPLNCCVLLFLSFRMVWACWFLHLHDRGVLLVALNSKVVPQYGRLWPTLYPMFWLLPWFSSSAITKRVLLVVVWCSSMTKSQGNISILPRYCPVLYYFIMLFLSSEQENTKFLYCVAVCGIAFFNMQSRNAVLPLHLYFFIASWIFHVETLIWVFFVYAFIAYFLLQNSGYFSYQHSWELCNSSWC